MSEEEKVPRQEVKAAVDWWRALQPAFNEAGTMIRSGDRAAIASLKRCSLGTAASEPACAALYQAMWPGSQGYEPKRFEKSAMLALVLPYAKAETASEGGYPTSFAGQIGYRKNGRKEGDDAPLISTIRFRAFLTAREPADIVRAFRRAVAAIDGGVNVRDLADAILGWHSERRRTRFAVEYFQRPSGNGQAAAS